MTGLIGYTGIGQMLAVDGKEASLRAVKTWVRDNNLRAVKDKPKGFRPADVLRKINDRAEGKNPFRD